VDEDENADGNIGETDPELSTFFGMMKDAGTQV
jgi:hypothetical protein